MHNSSDFISPFFTSLSERNSYLAITHVLLFFFLIGHSHPLLCSIKFYSFFNIINIFIYLFIFSCAESSVMCQLSLLAMGKGVATLCCGEWPSY